MTTHLRELLAKANDDAIAWAADRWPNPWDYAEREAAEEAYVAARNELPPSSTASTLRRRKSRDCGQRWRGPKVHSAQYVSRLPVPCPMLLLPSP
jgi:hypothetical protein